MTQTQQFDADVMATEPEGQKTFTYAGKPYIGQCTPIAGKLLMEEAGFGLDADFMMEVRLSQFVAPDRAPATQEVITMDNIEYRISATTPDQYGIVNNYALKAVS